MWLTGCHSGHATNDFLGKFRNSVMGYAPNTIKTTALTWD